MINVNSKGCDDAFCISIFLDSRKAMDNSKSIFTFQYQLVFRVFIQCKNLRDMGCKIILETEISIKNFGNISLFGRN